MVNFLVTIIPILIYAAIQLVGRREHKVHDDGIVLITGASSGIGRHAAEHFAKKHQHLVLAGVRKELDAKSIRQLGITNLQPIILDVTSHESCQKAVGEILGIMEAKKLPFIGLVNNAGVGRTLPIEFHSVEDARKVFDVNFYGVLDLVQLTLPMLRASEGRIIMISSVSGFVATPLSGIYSASKFAIEGFSDSLRREVAKDNISVSVVQPAFVKTSIHGADAFASAAVVRDPSIFASMKTLYGRFFTPVKEAARTLDLETADEPIVTSVAIERALVAPYPKTRYPVARAAGMTASFMTWVDWLLSDRLQDALIESL